MEQVQSDTITKIVFIILAAMAVLSVVTYWIANSIYRSVNRANLRKPADEAKIREVFPLMLREYVRQRTETAWMESGRESRSPDNRFLPDFEQELQHRSKILTDAGITPEEIIKMIQTHGGMPINKMVNVAVYDAVAAAVADAEGTHGAFF